MGERKTHTLWHWIWPDKLSVFLNSSWVDLYSWHAKLTTKYTNIESSKEKISLIISKVFHVFNWGNIF